MTTLSVLIPVKDEQANIRPLNDRLQEALKSWGGVYEIIIVDDGSHDQTFAILDEIAQKHPTVKIVRLRRNFGQTSALRAAIDHSAGDVLVTMDGDLQNDPADIPLLVNRLAEGYDMVLGERVARKDNFLIRKLPSRVANWLIRRVTGVPFRDFGCTLRAMRREVALALPLYGEMHRFITAMAIQQGARVTQVPVRHHPRIAGKTKYGLSRSVRVILDLMTVQFLYRYQARPMHLFGLIGLLLIAAGCVSLAVTWLMKQYSHMNMTGNPFLLLSVMLALMGTQSLALGLMGEMLARTYFESQDKPAYSVRETRNLDWRRPRRRRRRKNRVSKPTLDAGEIRG